MLILCIADVERDVGMKNLSPKEAITILEGMRIDIPVPKAAVTQIKRNLALDMAISALNCSEIPNNSDTISRQRSVDTLRKMQTYKLFAGDDMLLIDQAEAQTELMMLPPAQPEQRWIPCSERQPDKEGDYLVTLLDDGRTWVEIALWNETFGGRWQAVLYNDVDYSDISNVIAWKPLPEPYQEGGEKE